MVARQIAPNLKELRQGGREEMRRLRTRRSALGERIRAFEDHRDATFAREAAGCSGRAAERVVRDWGETHNPYRASPSVFSNERGPAGGRAFSPAAALSILLCAHNLSLTEKV